jgi:nicotinate phosphoribosyltransferase
VRPVPLMRGGAVVAEVPTLEESRQRVRQGLVSLPWEGLKLSHGEPAIPVVFAD